MSQHSRESRSERGSECPMCWGNGYTAGDSETDRIPCGICAETGRVMPYAPSETATTNAEAMLNWLGNRVLACDYGDNDAPGEQIGWRIRHDLLRGPNGERQPAFMYGKSFGEAITAELAKEKK